jgi:choline kinase
MNIVVLAAGKGIRLGDRTREIPKSLLEIMPGRPYLAYQLEAFSPFENAKKIMVGGFAIERLQEFLAGHQYGSAWQLVENREYQKGNLYSLAAARAQLEDDDFFVFNADHYYSDVTYQRILNIQTDQITIFCDHDRALVADDMKVTVRSGQLERIAKDLTQFDAGYVGVTYVPRAQAVRYWQAFAATALELGDRAYVEAVLARLAAEGEKIYISDMSGSWWTEIDTEEDLRRARGIIAEYSAA